MTRLEAIHARLAAAMQDAPAPWRLRRRPDEQWCLTDREGTELHITPAIRAFLAGAPTDQGWLVPVAETAAEVLRHHRRGDAAATEGAMGRLAQALKPLQRESREER